MSKHETPYQKMEDSTRPKMPQRAVTERVRSAPPPLSASTSVRTLMRMTSALENDDSRRDPHATTPRQRVMRRSFTSRQLNPLVRAARSLVWLTPVEEETFRCHICFDDIRVTEAIVLSSCGHRYCKPCFKPYLELKITEGNVYPVCFHPVETAQGAPGTLTNESAPTTTCGVAVEVSDIEEIVGPEIWKKYEYFRFNKEHQHARDCPFCSHSQDCVGPENPVCVCEQCNKTFCFFHGNAHENSSCADYELKTAQEESLNRAKIDEIAKPCPGCHRDVEKNGGCNHMKCVGCNTSFCWLCGEIIEDTPTPSHYAEGAGSCSGKQFEGMEDEGPGCRAILIILFLTVVTFIPATLIALVLAPFVWLFFRLKGVGGSWRFGRVFSKIQSTAMIILCTLVMLVLIPVLWVIDLCLLPFAFLAFLISDCCCSDPDEDDDSDGADPLASPPDLEASLTEELEGGMATEPQETAEKRAVYAV